MAGPFRFIAPARTAALAAVLILAWWVAAAQFTHGGNWTGLFCTGSLFHLPSWLEQQETILRDPAPHGYDGQIFHVMAHRPWPLCEILPYLDPPQLRYQRILIPALAYTLALGSQAWIDCAYFSLILVSLAAGAWWTARLAELRGVSAWWGLAFVLLPSSLASIDRMVVDGPLVTCVAVFAFCWETGRWRWAALLAAAAPFVRETGMFLPAAAALAALLRWGLPAALKWACAGLPFGLFSLWLSQLPGGIHARFAGLFYSIRLLLAEPGPQGSPAWFGQVLYWTALLALAALLSAAAVSLVQCWRRRAECASSPRAALWICGALYGAAAWLICHIEPRAAWDDFYSFGRVFSPVLLAVFLEWLACGRPLLAAALLLASAARMALQFVSPAFRILRALAGA